MRRRLWAVAVAAVVMAAAPGVSILGGGGRSAGASTTGRESQSTRTQGVVTPVAAVDDLADGAGTAARAGGSSAAVHRANVRNAGTSASTAGVDGRTGHGNGGPGAALTGPLRALAARRGIHVGAAMSAGNNVPGTQYPTVLGTEYNMLTPDNDMKFGATEPQPGVYDFVNSDLDVSFAQSHDMAVRGHNLAWWSGNPAWLTDVPHRRDELVNILHDHIQTVVTHYRGSVAQWDVVNEPLAGGFWQDNVGPEYIAMALRWAHEADPGAKLFVNETGAEGLGPRSDALYNLVRGLRQRGVPVDGVGLESHFDLNPPPLREIAANMQRLNALGVETAITELDVRLQLPASTADLDRQRVIYNGLLATCLAAANCKTFATWGFTDKNSWIPSAYPGYGAALPFDVLYAPKPAYFGLRAALGG